MTSLFDVFTVTFGRENKRRIAELETQIDTDAEEHATALAERTGEFRTFKNGVLGALGDAAPSADDSSAENIVAGVASLRSQVDTLTAESAPFREYIAAHPDEGDPDEAPEAGHGEDGGGEAGQVQVEVDNRPRDESGRFVTADDLDPTDQVGA